MTVIVCASCGYMARHEARGMCSSCYQKARHRGLLGGFAKGRRAPAGREPHRRDYYRMYKRAWYARQKGQ